MKRQLALALSLCSLSALATDFYLDNQASGSNSGTLANPWKDLTNIVWSSIQPGDRLLISGTAAGTTNVYVGYINHNGASANNGTAGSPITITTRRDAGHNGLVKIFGGVYIAKDYWTIDGALNTNWIPSSVMDTYRIGTNCNLEICNTNNDGNHGINYGSCKGQVIKWVHVSAAATQSLAPADVNALQLNGFSGGSKVEACEVAYCWLAGAWGYGFFMQGPVSASFGQCSIHHCLIEQVHDNYIECDGSIDIYNNVMRAWVPPSVGHPDIIQGITSCTRIWGNIMQDCPGTSIYIEPIGIDFVHDIYVYNNLFLTTTQYWHDGITITGAALTNTLAVSNVWFFGNTWHDPNGASVFTWNGGLNTVNGTSATNIHFLNNAVVLTNTATVPVLNFFTNLAYDNDTRGFAYAQVANGVEVNYNNIAGGVTGNGNGIRYGAHGDYYDGGYTNIAAFASDYPVFSLNNNLTPWFVSLPNGDFRPGSDKALKGLGTNLIAALTNVCPACGTDLLGNARPLTGAWDIGAYQSDPTLKLWLSANNWNGLTNIWDDSGNTNHGIAPYQWPTNYVTVTNHNGAGAWAAMNYISWPGPPAEPGGSAQFVAVTNLSGGIEFLTNATLAVWAWFGTNIPNTAALMDSGYYDEPNSFNLGRYFSANTLFSIWTNSTQYLLLGFPDTGISNSWHHYAVTYDGTKYLAYFDGVVCFTNTTSLVPYLGINHIVGNTTDRWLALGTWKHQGAPTIDYINPPNCCWFGGMMDDVRVYNRALSASEISGLVLNAGTSQSAQSNGGTNTWQTTATSTMSGNIQTTGRIEIH